MIFELINTSSNDMRLTKILNLKEKMNKIKQEKISEENSNQLQILDNELSDALKEYLTV
ncbi:hypothetical protein [Anaerosolibacter sp.]|uniref:hypothetical protein n=1 Tax=Anaerosolibacter sp. TaxID=1872527 RepID=UPI0039F011B1